MEVSEAKDSTRNNSLDLAYLPESWIVMAGLPRKSDYGVRVCKDRINTEFHIRIGCKQVDKEAIQMFSQTFGGSIRIEKPNAKKGKPLYSWSISDKSAFKASVKLLSFLRIKREQASILINLYLLKKEKKGIIERKHKTRWGENVVFKNKCFSQDQIKGFNNLYLKIRTLNDTRWQNLQTRRW